MLLFRTNQALSVDLRVPRPAQLPAAHLAKVRVFLQIKLINLFDVFSKILH